MGAWGFGIMEGDTPLDIECDIYKLFEIEQYDEDDNEVEITADIYEDNLDKFEDWFTCLDTDLNFLVLGVMMMEAGADIPRKFKDAMYEACESELDSVIDQGWSEPEKRIRMLNDFNKKLQNYKNQKIKFDTKGLLEIIYDGEKNV